MNTSVEIRPIDRTDESQQRRVWEIGEICSQDRPASFYWAWEGFKLGFHPSTDTPDAEVFATGAWLGDELVGCTYGGLPMHDNMKLLWLDRLDVLPEHRRQGIGTMLLDDVVDLARRRDRSVLVSGAEETVDGVRSAGLEFALAREFTEANRDGLKVVDLDATESSWPALAEKSAAASDGFRLVSWHGGVPEVYVDGMLVLLEAFLAEAPMGDLEIEPEKWTEERLRAQEERGDRVGRHSLMTVAVAPDGELAGFTEIAVSEHTPMRGFQSGTLVLPAYRGHQLGLAMKVANHQFVRAEFPQCHILKTGNAGVNAHMNAVNDLLGYGVVESWVELQRRL